MKPLYLDAMRAPARLRPLALRSVPRAQNAAADALVNQALDAAR